MLNNTRTLYKDIEIYLVRTFRKLVQQTGAFVSEDQKEGLDLNQKDGKFCILSSRYVPRITVGFGGWSGSSERRLVLTPRKYKIYFFTDSKRIKLQ